MARGSRGSTAAGQALGAAGGGLLLAATFLPWSGRGAGSAIALARIADLVLSGRVDAWVPRAGGLVVYAIPLGGALVLLGVGLGGRLGTVLAAAGTASAVLGSVVAHTALGRLGREGWGAGAVAGLGGVALGAAAAAVQAVAARRATSPPG